LGVTATYTLLLLGFMAAPAQLSAPPDESQPARSGPRAPDHLTERLQVTTKNETGSAPMYHVPRDQRVAAPRGVHAATLAPAVEHDKTALGKASMRNSPAKSKETALNSQTIARELDEQLLAEQYDFVWASEVERQLVYGFHELLPRGNNDLVDSRCQSSLCRVEVRHADSQAEVDFVREVSNVGAMPDGITDFFYRRLGPDESGDGYSHSVFYLARSGVGWPTHVMPARRTAPAKASPGKHDVKLPQ
jgi:hypothetical protein